jgi:outer membrane receptor for ferrienterochelin and colicins
MKISIILTAALLFIGCNIFAQHNFSCFVKDAESKEILQDVSAKIENSTKAIASDNNGRIAFTNLAAGKIKITFSFVGYDNQTASFQIPGGNTVQIIYLQKAEKKEEEVIVSSSRTNSRIEDLPTKVEVLGSEEVGEENGIKPGNIASLLGDVAGIQIQQTSATTGNADARIQGLPGKYSQILRDGLPLFGGYSGSFSILQIPPLDLKQIEIIKGSSSTLYGGGAIAGMLNLISKSPRLNSPERSITINQSTLKESNGNLFLSNRNKKTGYTLFAGGTYQRAVDVNKDGYSDVPDLKTVFFHPRLFFYPNQKQTVIIGYNLTYEDRNGGDMQVLHQTKDNNHQFFIQNKSLRNTVDAAIETKLNANDRLTIKGTTSFFNRDITTNVFGMKAKQLSYFSELTYFKKLTKHNIVGGINFSGENFRKKNPDSTRFDNYNYITAGIFVQDDWKITQKFIVEAGLRLDNHNVYGNFVLPRLSLLYKINTHFTTRLGGGYGYKIPSQFASDIDERDYLNFYPGTNIKAEKSTGANWDINYKTVANGWHLTVNQMFYVTEIKDPLVEFTIQNGMISFSSASKPLNTKGFETYVAATHDELEIYFGYTYTNAKQLYDAVHPNVSLSARNKFATVIAYEFSSHFRAGIEASYTGKQYLDNGNTTPGYLFGAAMMRYDIKNVALVLNCENLFDYRQTKKESIISSGAPTNPIFKQIWAPIDGRVINLSARINF